ncbi:MAG: hypothetical protein CVV22_11515 [Ignavibacteriae bacterium HGW-Ignavibacteriae-1]|jgi:uncharacterized protein (DUF1697 family)|nr:MAG: hypothetical protein CVV22_11515 [Ignavibacteriae bacterium HGW-Ignavibacteriae-1]
MNHYLALLRGINVGGNNIIKMANLKLCFESLGLNNVQTYIQSGNVIFQSDDNDIAELTQKIESGLSNLFNYKSKIVLITRNQMEKVVDKAPKGFGEEPEQFRYDVLFLKAPLTATEAMNGLSVRDGVDQAYQGDNVIYFSRLISKAGQSYLNKIIKLGIYKSMTVRNWNTTTKLYSMMKL